MIDFFLISLFLPLTSSLIAGFFPKKSFTIGIISSLLMIISTISSFILLEAVLERGSINIFLSHFINVGFLDLSHSFVLDSVSVMMAVMVGIVASVVHIYSIWYMANDDGFNRFFSYLGLFVFSMLVLVLSDNFIGLFIGWEGVGLCSWLLIGFWYQRDKISWFANEAFIMNRIADLGILIALFLIYKNLGSLKYETVFSTISNLDKFNITLIAGLLFFGAMGKSAQFPFHTWLADAMAGPTPVSALIHAATMVTAGVYLVIRANEIFINAAFVSEFIVILGVFVALFGASMALVNDDLKKIIAYSTLSQLGYMFVAAGLGAYWIALFHLIAHAFFKSLLFLCAGNIMHAMNDDLNIQKMGGLNQFLKPTFVLMTIASLALVGIYPFAGFFSKDKILEAAFYSQNFMVWACLLIGAMMTAFYSFRLIMLVFFGKTKFTHKPHDARVFVIVSLSVLAVLSTIAGFFEGNFHKFIISTTGDFNMKESNQIFLIFITLFCVISSALFAIYAYKFNIFKENLKENMFYKLLKNEYYIPKIYETIFIKPYYKMAEICSKIDNFAIDKSVDFIAKSLLLLSNKFDKTNTSNLSFMLRYFIFGFTILLILAFILEALWS